MTHHISGQKNLTLGCAIALTVKCSWLFPAWLCRNALEQQWLWQFILKRTQIDVFKAFVLLLVTVCLLKPTVCVTWHVRRTGTALPMETAHEPQLFSFLLSVCQLGFVPFRFLRGSSAKQQLLSASQEFCLLLNPSAASATWDVRRGVSLAFEFRPKTK